MTRTILQPYIMLSERFAIRLAYRSLNRGSIWTCCPVLFLLVSKEPLLHDNSRVIFSHLKIVFAFVIDIQVFI